MLTDLRNDGCTQYVKTNATTHHWLPPARQLRQLPPAATRGESGLGVGSGKIGIGGGAAELGDSEPGEREERGERREEGSRAEGGGRRLEVRDRGLESVVPIWTCGGGMEGSRDPCKHETHGMTAKYHAPCPQPRNFP